MLLVLELRAEFYEAFQRGEKGVTEVANTLEANGLCDHTDEPVKSALFGARGPSTRWVPNNVHRG